MEGRQSPPPPTSPHYLFTPFHPPSIFPSTPSHHLPVLGFPSLINSGSTSSGPINDQNKMIDNSCGVSDNIIDPMIEEDDHIDKLGNNNTNKRRKISRSRKSSIPRFEFQTRSEEDILDDGYRWRKYGQKSVKNSKFPRSYYRCTHHTCSVKKQVQRLSKDATIVVTTYEGTHNHPCEKLMETLTPLLKQIQLLTSTNQLI